MIFATKPEIGTIVLNELQSAIDVRLAVAYFIPDDIVLSALKTIQTLKLIISEEFTFNNPYKLEELLDTAIVRSIPTDHDNGKLHAKVLIAKRPDGSLWVLVGSANITGPGLFSNQEACIALDSRNVQDRVLINEVIKWFDSLLKNSRAPNLDEAKQIFEARKHYRWERRPKPDSVSYWAIKTTEGAEGAQHWPRFLAENVIAIGWERISGNPSGLSNTQLLQAIKDAYPESKGPKDARSKIIKFRDLNLNDIVLLCRGYRKQTKPVHIYGFARVTGPFQDTKTSDWNWRFKRSALIQVVNQDLPYNVVAAALKKDALLGTINNLDQSGFNRLVDLLGVRIEV